MHSFKPEPTIKMTFSTLIFINIFFMFCHFYYKICWFLQYSVHFCLFSFRSFFLFLFLNAHKLWVLIKCISQQKMCGYPRFDFDTSFFSYLFFQRMSSTFWVWSLDSMPLFNYSDAIFISIVRATGCIFLVQSAVTCAHNRTTNAKNAVKPVGKMEREKEKNWYVLIVISWRKNRLMIANWATGRTH